MKYIVRLLGFLAVSASLLFVSCNNEVDDFNPRNNTNTPSVTGRVGSVTTTRAVLFAWANLISINEGTFGIAYSDNPDSKPENFQRVRAQALSGDNSYSCEIQNLVPGKTYRYCSYIEYLIGNLALGEIHSFTTKQAVFNSSIESTSRTGASILTSTNITDCEKAVFGIVLLMNETAPDEERLHTYGQQFSAQSLALKSDHGEYRIQLSDLAPGKTYWCCPYAKVENNYVYGPMCSFVTSGINVRTLEAGNISACGAVFSYSTSNLKELKDAKVGVLWSSKVAIPDQMNCDEGIYFTYDGENQDEVTSLYVGGLSQNTKYYYRSFVSISGEDYYGEVKSFKTHFQVEPEVVDLGLSTYWASCNLGAMTPEEQGDYYAYGEPATKTLYTALTYKYFDQKSYSFLKYTDEKPYPLTELASEDDAARTVLGDGFKTPTASQWRELISNCTWSRQTLNGVLGWKVSANNGNSIFLPASGIIESDLFFFSETYEKDHAAYMSSTYDSWALAKALLLSSSSAKVDRCGQFYGISVRPVTTAYYQKAYSIREVLENYDELLNKSITIQGVVFAQDDVSIIVGNSPSYHCAVEMKKSDSTPSLKVGDRIRARGSLYSRSGYLEFHAYNNEVWVTGETTVDFKTFNAMIGYEKALTEPSYYMVPLTVKREFAPGYYDCQISSGDNLLLYVDGTGFVPEVGERYYVYGFSTGSGLVVSSAVSCQGEEFINEQSLSSNLNKEVSYDGIVTGINTLGYVLSSGADAGNHCFVYKSSSYTCPYSIGDMIAVRGQQTVYNRGYQISNVNAEFKYGENPSIGQRPNYVYGNLLDDIYDAAYYAGIVLFTKLISTFGQLYAQDGEYFLVHPYASKTKIRVWYPTEELVSKMRTLSVEYADSPSVNIDGFVTGIRTSDSSLNVLVTDVYVNQH